MEDMENLNTNDYKTILFSLMIFFGLGLAAVLVLNYFSLAFLSDDPRGGILTLLGAAIPLNLIFATYPILYGMALALAFINWKKNQKRKAIKYQFLPLISVGLCLIIVCLVSIIVG